MNEFHIGDLVFIKDLEDYNHMSHFQQKIFALITEVNDGEYMTDIGGWYPGESLELIQRNPNTKLLARLRKTEEE